MSSPKHISSPSPSERPTKRSKTHHPSHNARPAAYISLNGDRPLTSCSSNEVCGPPTHDLPAPRLVHQSICLRPSTSAHLHHHACLDQALPFDNPTSHSNYNATHHAPYISSPHPSSSTSLQTPPSPPTNHTFGAHMSYFSSFPHFLLPISATAHSEASPLSDDCIALYNALDTTDFAHDTPCDLFDFGELDLVGQPHMSSPVSRTLSRSSWASNSFMDVSSPYSEDYPTPTSDSAVTTPAPIEPDMAVFSPDFPASLYSDSFFGTEDKTKGEHELPYVLGSAPFSPNALPFDLPTFPQPAPTSAPSGGLTARRYSEPANPAACHFSQFFTSSQDFPAQLVPGLADFMTLPITDNLTLPMSSSASHSALPSSIAPHQIELPRPLEIHHPRPVRGFKPPILLSGDSYDPNDFVRRHSEPILPLRELDVASHFPMEESEDDDVDDEDAFEDEDEDALDDGTVKKPVNQQGSDSDWLGLTPDCAPLFNPTWSWMQSSSDGTALPPLDWHSLSGGLDFSFPFALPPNTTPGSGFGDISWNVMSS